MQVSSKVWRHLVLGVGIISQAAVIAANFDGLKILPIQLAFSFWILLPFFLFFGIANQVRFVWFIPLIGGLLAAMHTAFIAIYFFSRSSTSAILFLFTPIYEIVFLGIVGLIAALFSTILRRRK